MHKANAFKKSVLLGGLVGMLLTAVPVSARTIIQWSPTGIHQGMPLAMDGRPKFMVESIDLLNNAITFEYVNDGEVMGVPAEVGVAWFKDEREIQDTSQMEAVSEIEEIGKAALSTDFGSGERVGSEGDIERYTFRNLSKNLGNQDPTGKWMYFLRLETVSGNVFWNGQVDYTRCIIAYRDEVNDVTKRLTKGICRGSYDASGVVKYSLEVEYGGIEEETGGETSGETGGETSGETGGETGGEASGGAEGETGGEAGSGDEGETGGGSSHVTEENAGGSDELGGGEGNDATTGVDWAEMGNDATTGVDWAEAVKWAGVTLTSYRGNEVEILSRAETGGTTTSDGGSIGLTVEGDANDANDNDEKEEFGEGETNEVEVPELNGEEAKKDKIQWWMIPVLGMLALGVGAWWFLPIVKRRKDDEEES